MRYTVRKRSGQWVVCDGDRVLLTLDDHIEAIETAWSAAGVLLARA